MLLAHPGDFRMDGKRYDINVSVYHKFIIFCFQIWRDLKLKEKLVSNKSEYNTTGGGRFKQLPLTPLEEDISNLLQFGKPIN